MITKTDYVTFRTCNRSYYYCLNNKDQAKPEDDIAKKRKDEGILVNEYAHRYFENTIKVKQNLKVVNINNQVEVTKKLLNDAKAIAEASFQYEDLFCAVDILVKVEDGWAIYEVKAATDIKKHLEQYCADIAFQKYVLEKCNLKIKACYVLYLNKNYVRNGQIDIKQLLIPYKIDQEPMFNSELSFLPTAIKQIRQLQSSKQLPDYGDCSKSCDFFEFCHANLPKPNITQLYRFSINKAHDLIKKGIVSFLDSKKIKKLSNFQSNQIKAVLDNKVFIDRQGIKGFLDSLKYPIYHLDFETMNEAIPMVDGIGPYWQVPFQYSLHVQDKPGAKPKHYEFLGDKLDCQYELAKQLCKDIPLNVTSIAYNMTFEKTVLKQLANRFNDLKDHLMNIHDHMVDLMKPFDKGFYFNPKQANRTSIKYVMPALVPNHANDYHDLPVVKNGAQALAMFPKLFKLSGKELLEKRKGMLEYCKLDTYSMVWVLDELWKVVKEK